MKQKLNTYEIWQPFLLASMMAIGMIIGNKMTGNEVPMIEAINTEASPIGRVEEIVRFLETKYVDSLDSDQILEDAITDIIDDLDPHSIYLSANQLKSINEQMEGSYRGIGVESFYLNDTVQISKVIEGSPAQEVGIQPFDRLVAIDNSTVAGNGMKYSDIRNLLRAEGKESITLSFIRKGNPEPIVLKVKPSSVALHSSDVSYEIDEQTGFIKIDRFSGNTYKEFMESLEDLVENDSVRNLIIDVRDNPGGYLPETVNILSQLFNEKDKLLVYTADKNGRKTEYKSSGKNFFRLHKIVVLIDENSASGSEILAGAIQEWDRGLIIGRRSFGKGLVQEQYKLRNGGAIRLTTARYYTPSGRSIQKPYADDEDYRNELYNRYENGELLDPEVYTVSDSLIYFTQNLKRKLYGGGGVFPDIFIPVDSSYSTLDLSQLKGYIPEFVYTLRNDRRSINYETIDEFWQFLEEKGLERDAKWEGNISNPLIVLLQSEMAYQQNGTIEREKVLLADDPFIEAALKFIQSEDNIRDYLSEINKR